MPLLVWTQLAARDPPRPDLIIDRPLMEASWTVGLRHFSPGDCNLVEGCVLAPGLRKLLVFSIQTANISQADLELGDPTSSPFFAYSPCHGHYHLEEFSDYQLSPPGGGSTLVTSRKQDWCLVDIQQYVFEPWVSQTPAHDCGNQGLTAGWSDIYGAGLECQWLDVTDMAPGDYDLTAIVNAGGRIHELDTSNNSSTVRVSVPDLSGDPDLVLDAGRVASSLLLEEKTFSASDPAFVDGCLGGIGLRRILRFDAAVTNVSPSDLYIGDPAYESLITFSFGHKHHHLARFIEYQLVDLVGNPVTPARSPTNWLPADMFPSVAAPWVRPEPFYWAHYWMASASPVVPGIQRGWSSINPAWRDCQWVDVTNVPDGRYRLRATLNPDGIFRESNPGNNIADVPVQLTGGTSQGVSHRPDGNLVPGAPLEALPMPGGATRLLYDVGPASCPAQDYNIYYGEGAPGISPYSGAVCNIGVSGDTAVTLPDPAPGGLLWFLIVGREGNHDGGHGFDSQGVPRPLTGAGFCSVEYTAPRNWCGEI